MDSSRGKVSSGVGDDAEGSDRCEIVLSHGAPRQVGFLFVEGLGGLEITFQIGGLPEVMQGIARRPKSLSERLIARFSSRNRDALSRSPSWW